MKGKRSNWDFTDYVMSHQKDSLCEIFTFAKPENKKEGVVRFTMTEHGMMITGDFGKYIVSRSFYPTKDFKLSDDYFLGKIQSQTQNIFEYCQESTLTRIEEYFAQLEPEGELTHDTILEMREELSCYDFETSEDAFNALKEVLWGFDCDAVEDLIVQKPIRRILIIMDAFDLTCEHLGSLCVGNCNPMWKVRPDGLGQCSICGKISD